MSRKGICLGSDGRKGQSKETKRRKVYCVKRRFPLSLKFSLWLTGKLRMRHLFQDQSQPLFIEAVLVAEAVALSALPEVAEDAS